MLVVLLILHLNILLVHSQKGLQKNSNRKGAKMKVKILAPAMTETEFAKSASDMKEFDYEANVPMYHTAKQMAGFMMELYNNDKVVGYRR